MKKLVWLGIVLLALVILVLGIAGVSTAIFGNNYQAQVAAIKAKGEPLTLKDLVGKPTPPLEDAAIVYSEMHRRTAAGAYDEDSEEIEKVINSNGTRMDSAARKRLSKALAHSQPLLDLAVEAASRPRYALAIDPATGAAELPNLAETRRACRLLSARSLLRAQSGDMAGAAGDIVAQFRTAAQLEDGSTILAQLVRIALVAVGTKSLTDSAGCGDLSEAQARQIYDAVRAVDMAEGFRQGWIGERVSFLANTDPAAIRRASRSTGEGVLGSIYAKTVLRGDQAAYLRFMEDQIAGAKLSYQEAKARGLLDKATSIPAYAFTAKSTASVFEEMSFKRFASEERLARTQAFLALQACKARYGRYPASMQELRSKLGWRIPKDPFSGKDYIYKRQAKGFVLYSIGPDMKDDGGMAAPHDPVHQDDKGDVVLRWTR